MVTERVQGAATCLLAAAVGALATGWSGAAVVLAALAGTAGALVLATRTGRQRAAHRRSRSRSSSGSRSSDRSRQRSRTLEEVVEAVLEVRRTGSTTTDAGRGAADGLYRLMHAHATGADEVPQELVEAPAEEVLAAWTRLPGIGAGELLDGVRRSSALGHLPVTPAVQRTVEDAAARHRFTTSDTALLDWVHDQLDEGARAAAAAGPDPVRATFTRTRRAAPRPQPAVTGRVLRVLLAAETEVLETYLQLVEDAAASGTVGEEDHLRLVQVARAVNA